MEAENIAKILLAAFLLLPPLFVAMGLAQSILEGWVMKMRGMSDAEIREHARKQMREIERQQEERAKQRKKQ